MLRHLPARLDEIKMNGAAKLFVGEKDFSGFMATGSKVRDTVRTVTATGVQRYGNTVIFRVTGNGFLYNMVRIMTGTLVEYSLGRRSLDDIISALENGDRKKAGITAPACGLYLVNVKY